MQSSVQVAEALDRRPKWPKYYRIKSEEDLLRELKSTQLQLFGNTKQMPSRSQLLEFGRQELLQAINDAGEFQAMVPTLFSLHHMHNALLQAPPLNHKQLNCRCHKAK